MVTLAYVPVLIASPFLLVLGIFVVVVPGGFILVLAGLYALLQLLGVAALATARYLLLLRGDRRRRATVRSRAMARRGRTLPTH